MPGLDKAPAGEYLTDRLAAEAEAFLEANKAKPFFLYLPHYAPHIPMRAKEELIAKYRPGQPGQQGNPIYAAMLESLDDAVGRVLKKLDELKLSDNTIVVFTSDNGGLCTLEGPNTPPTINAPLREGKGYLYEGGLARPAAREVAGRDEGRLRRRRFRCRASTSFPTFARRLCGLRRREDRRGESGAGAQGRDAGPRSAVLALSALQQPGG